MFELTKGWPGLAAFKEVVWIEATVTFQGVGVCPSQKILLELVINFHVPLLLVPMFLDSTPCT